MATGAKSNPEPGWLGRRWRGIRRRPHLSTAAGIFLVLVATLIGAGVELARGTLIAFDVAALIFLGAMARMFTAAKTADMKRQAAEQDSGRWGVLAGSVAITGVVAIALGVELGGAHAGSTREVALAATSLLLAWLYLNTIFAVHYAHAFYACGGRSAPLQFPGTPEPDYWDFVYFAFVLGMTFQVSDVAVAGRGVRRIALAHGIVAFVFNVVILALSVNIVAGRF